MNPRIVVERADWNRALLSLPAPHLLQTWQWGESKAQTGWSAHRILWQQDEQPRAAASLLVRQATTLPLKVAYVPKGPILDWSDASLADQVLADLQREARRLRVLFIKIDPDVSPESPEGRRLLKSLATRGWRFSNEQIQFRNTALVDLRPGEDELLAAMKSKWRYNIRLAERRGVEIRRGNLDDLSTFYSLYAETGQRDGFIVRPYEYYAHTWRTFLAPQDDDSPSAFLLLAEVDGDPIAGLMLFSFGEMAWYMYGASSSRHRKLMPNHRLQWEAMRLARQQGCRVYDLWGAPDQLDETDPMWGVWRFKQGFGAQFSPHIGAWDYPVSSPLYRTYTVLMPKILDRMRGRHRTSTAVR
ncbi:MAG: peptidoglycan bridge formation glycyltransferase FemA/FemB family protein [Chloroflexota bacterium]|nr:peptidoglycan bridge formation glycyltransferase FemA/FemB family protein [Chloroflexota bacterium]